MIEICDIIIRVSSEATATTTTTRSNVSPAEVAILRQAKGANSIFYNGNLRLANRQIGTEVARLQQVHGAAFTAIFPGLSPVIPTTFDQIGLDTSKPFEGEPYVPHPDEAQKIEEVEEVVRDAPVAVKAPTKRASKKTKTREDFSDK